MLGWYLSELRRKNITNKSTPKNKDIGALLPINSSKIKKMIG